MLCVSPRHSDIKIRITPHDREFVIQIDKFSSIMSTLIDTKNSWLSDEFGIEQALVELQLPARSSIWIMESPKRVFL